MKTDTLRDFENYMRSKNYAQTSIQTYLSCLKLFLGHFNKAPQNISLAEIREYLARLSSAAYMKQHVGTLRILYTHTY